MSAPNRINIVEAVHRDHPGLIHRPHDFTAVVCAALHAVDPRFGLNGKRGNPHDTSEDCTAYLDDTSPLVGSDGRRIRIIDFIGAANSSNAHPAWIDQTQATIAKGTTGVWVQPGRVEPGPVVPTPTPPPQPQPAPPSTDLSAIKALLASLLDQQQILVQGQAAQDAALTSIKAALDNVSVFVDHMVNDGPAGDQSRAPNHITDIKERLDAIAAQVAAKGDGRCRLRF